MVDKERREEDNGGLAVNTARENETTVQEAGLTRLSDLPSGQVGTVHSLKGGRHFVSRMVSLGFTPGTEVRVMQNYGHCSLIASVRNTRVALGRGEAQKVLVTRKDGNGK
jgi:Fe2+ transport system protein FeoA